ncbi:1-deoxy-D-xylulose-5-phosphate synthase [Solibaculum mannosilyticum]|uniref:1-deoxy-D-xylulose-5-phosphate synthase n=1 Tax=Solibaculum mannosilyticum TaxID=2780922 RepID=A0A7I8D129_9FIRM|nr:1-deoxy-D-xylulose-5-phosphate synthase [Solibaculum mannosilyticum]BCI60501.1 1-deoxy-D-xylulose-5-phosphate synthase [Solibaculum mannosilyticum]
MSTFGRLLSSIKGPEDIKNMTFRQLDDLCAEIRRELIGTVSHNGGHLASNLGVVELSVALHKVFCSPHDQIVWDVGHQCYTHKLLTGRYQEFFSLRQENGLSGFCRPEESEHDSFVSGHSSTSISAAFGLAKAKELMGDDSYTIAVIGDGALTGGLAYEAINNAGRSKSKLIVILNDNKMSISRNVGSIARHLAGIRSKPAYFRLKSRVEKAILKLPKAGVKIENGIIKMKAGLKNVLYGNTIFENMGFAYVGPVDGHNLRVLCDVLESSKEIHRPVLLHVCTVKGKGYIFAEENPKAFHGTSGFNIGTGNTEHADYSFSKRFGTSLCTMARTDTRICAITAAMASGVGLNEFAHQYRNRFFDVGIAEQHAITFASGLAKNGLLPAFAVYSTFLQRGYDQIIHDAALQNLKIVLAIDRAGLVGEDGETHQGVFDASFLHTIPNITILAPSSYDELDSMLKDAFYHYKGVVALRYPRGEQGFIPQDYHSQKQSYTFYGDPDAPNLIVTFGRLFSEACLARDILNKNGKAVCILKLNVVKPMDPSVFDKVKNFSSVFFYEEGMQEGGIGQSFGFQLYQVGFKGKFSLHALPDQFIPQSTVASALTHFGLDAQAMAASVLQGEKTVE